MKPKNTPVLTRLGGDARRPGPFQRTTRITLALALVLSHPLWAATIIVDETTCTLVDAITAANTDTAVNGCAAGSGADTITLTTDVTLTQVNNGSGGNANGLPPVESEITVEGSDFTISRAASADFRVFEVLPSGALTLNNVSVRNGRASFGGGIRCQGVLTLTNTTVSDNLAYEGGGIWASAGALSVINSTVASNSAYAPAGWARGGGIFLTGGSANLTNSTVSGNSADSDYGYPYYEETGIGGGILNLGGAVTLTNSTMTGNWASFCLAGLVSYGASANVANSIIADGSYSCWGDITNNGNNFSDDVDRCPGFADITPGVDLDTELADNGGPTQTHALFPGSVAIDAAGACGLGADQRGAPRDDGACDSGSYELRPCGDGILDVGEDCDDGNDVSCDGCSSECVTEEGYICGDGILNTDCGEQCDDGNTQPGDGCRANCTLEICGDGVLDPQEECDDGNNDDGDGCSADCTIEQDVPASSGVGLAVLLVAVLGAGSYLTRRRVGP